MAENTVLKKHKLKLIHNEIVEIQGVVAVVDYSDNAVNVKLSDCYLTIKGEKFNVESLNLESGELHISGKVSAINYSKTREKGGFVKRLLK